MIDAHCHLNDARLRAHIEQLLARMAEAGVTGALVVGYDVPSSRLAVALARQHPQLRAAVGMHPHESKDLDDAALAALRELAQQPEVVAYGEIGLDYYYDHSPREVQRQAFRRQLRLANELALPIIIHERDAVDFVLGILEAEDGGAHGGMWHCCSVAPESAVRIAEKLHVGIAGWVTFPKMASVRDIARAVPLERLLVETDAPYLTPVPFRHQPYNEPAYVQYTVAKVAEVRGVSTEEVDRVTTENVARAFPRWEM